MNITNLKFAGIIACIFLLSGCDLPLQEEFDFKPEAELEAPFKDITAWEFIQSRTPGFMDNGRYEPLEFNYMEAAIRKADMVEEYNQVATTDRTYLILDNRGFTGRGNVIDIVTGSSAAPPNETADETFARVDTPEKLEKLRTLLRYHILASYVLQDTMFEKDTDYLFQTLIPGDDGLIAFRRDVIYRIIINHPDAPLPSTATSETAWAHNYQFINGVGHILRDPVRNKPY